MRLETEMYLVTIGSSPALNLRKSIERAGYKVRELVLEPLASSFAVVTDDEKELGVALVEMGAGTTDLAIFHEEKIRFLGTIAYGGAHVTSDIVHGLGVTQADAERLKEKYGCAYEPIYASSDEVITLPSTVAQGDREIKRELLAHIIHQRMDEIFGLVQPADSRLGIRRATGGGCRAHGWRVGDRGRRESGERRVRHGRAGWIAGVERGWAERCRRGAALLHRRGARALRRASNDAGRGRLGCGGKAKVDFVAGRGSHRTACQDVAAGFFLVRWTANQIELSTLE